MNVISAWSNGFRKTFMFVFLNYPLQNRKKIVTIYIRLIVMAVSK